MACPSVIVSFSFLTPQKKIIALPENESGNPAYIMINNNISYESSFIEKKKAAHEVASYGADGSRVSLTAAVSKRSLS